MEQKTWSVHSDMEESQKPVQNQKKEAQPKRKDRPFEIHQQLLKQTLAELEEVKLMLRTIFAGLKSSFNFEQPLIERIVGNDELDPEILRLLFEAGSAGLLPKEMAAKLERFKVQRFQVSEESCG
jgi:hypothetical protein